LLVKIAMININANRKKFELAVLMPMMASLVQRHLH